MFNKPNRGVTVNIRRECITAPQNISNQQNTADKTGGKTMPAIQNNDEMMREKHSLSNDIEQLKQEKEELLASLKRVQEELEQLKKQKSDLQEDANSQAERILNGAQEQAERILNEAQEQADSIRHSVIAGIASEAETAEECLIPNDVISKEYLEKETRQLEITIRDALDQYRKELDKYRDNLYSEINEFRNGLYAVEYTPLCSAYQRLCRYVKVTLEKRIADVENDSASEEAAQYTKEILRKQQGSLIKCILAFERGLESMGMSIIRPANNEKYNEDEHMAENAEDDGMLETEIRWCVYPGVKYGDRVLRRASVMLKSN